MSRPHMLLEFVPGCAEASWERGIVSPDWVCTVASDEVRITASADCTVLVVQGMLMDDYCY